MLIPKSNIPSPASIAPIIRQSGCNVRSDAPRVVIEPIE